MSGSRLRPYLGPAIALLVVLALGAGTVYAAIPNGSGTYYACLTKSSGAVRLINYPKQKCATGERFIKWNQQGPAGPQGAQGPAGPQGPKGDQGPAGVSGSSNWGDIANKPADLADGQIGWGEVANKPADLADGQIGWDNVTGKPAGFADNVDNVTGITLTRKVGAAFTNISPGASNSVSIDCPAGSKVTGGGAFATDTAVYISGSYPFDGDTWNIFAANTSATTVFAVLPYAICMSTNPSSAITTAKKGVVPAAVKKAIKKRDK